MFWATSSLWMMIWTGVMLVIRVYEGLDDNDALEFQHSSSVVPDLLVDRSERELLTSRLDLQRQHLEMPSFRQTPIDEGSGHCIAWLFQPCFLYGRNTQQAEGVSEDLRRTKVSAAKAVSPAVLPPTSVMVRNLKGM
ncbi:hypothetical protein V8E54_002487 [Elaphomyces granulatus]|jgi:hypothetical protein